MRLESTDAASWQSSLSKPGAKFDDLTELQSTGCNKYAAAQNCVRFLNKDRADDIPVALGPNIADMAKSNRSR
ncbi:MAG: hypothetical protein AAFW60_03485, partial [Pseudomonadota bacterium]